MVLGPRVAQEARRTEQARLLSPDVFGSARVEAALRPTEGVGPEGLRPSGKYSAHASRCKSGGLNSCGDIGGYLRCFKPAGFDWRNRVTLYQPRC